MFYFDKGLRLKSGAERLLPVSKQNKFIAGLFAFCAVIWVLAALHPLDRQAWVLENVLLVLFVFALSLSHRHLRLSNAAYIFIAAFVILHIIGAHYTYAKIPLGLWAKEVFGFSRNHLDRVGHFGFGFFLAFPVRELLLRFGRIHRAWSYWLPPAMILAMSGFFEILESIVAETIAPGKGVDWLGGQGDEWDAQNDMLAALLGALVMMAAVRVTTRKETHG